MALGILTPNEEELRRWYLENQFRWNPQTMEPPEVAVDPNQIPPEVYQGLPEEATLPGAYQGVPEGISTTLPGLRVDSPVTPEGGEGEPGSDRMGSFTNWLKAASMTVGDALARRDPAVRMAALQDELSRAESLALSEKTEARIKAEREADHQLKREEFEFDQQQALGKGAREQISQAMAALLKRGVDISQFPSPQALVGEYHRVLKEEAASDQATEYQDIIDDMKDKYFESKGLGEPPSGALDLPVNRTAWAEERSLMEKDFPNYLSGVLGKTVRGSKRWDAIKSYLDTLEKTEESMRMAMEAFSGSPLRPETLPPGVDQGTPTGTPPSPFVSEALPPLRSSILDDEGGKPRWEEVRDGVYETRYGAPMTDPWRQETEEVNEAIRAITVGSGDRADFITRETMEALSPEQEQELREKIANWRKESESLPPWALKDFSNRVRSELASFTAEAVPTAPEEAFDKDEKWFGAEGDEDQGYFQDSPLPTSPRLWEKYLQDFKEGVNEFAGKREKSIATRGNFFPTGTRFNEEIVKVLTGAKEDPEIPSLDEFYAAMKEVGEEDQAQKMIQSMIRYWLKTVPRETREGRDLKNWFPSLFHDGKGDYKFGLTHTEIDRWRE